MATATVTSADRLTFTLFMAMVLHASFILGISFSTALDSNNSTTLEVTLAHYKSDEAPDQADFLAQENQQGSGTLEQAKMMTTDVFADFDANKIQQTSPEQQQASAPKHNSELTNLVSTTGNSLFKTQLNLESAKSVSELPDGPQKTLLQRSLEIASLEAKLDTMRQVYAKAPRVQRLTAASTMKANDAYYVNSWRRKIEKMGAMNYPKEADNCFNDCILRLLVAIKPNGTIDRIQILQSSGRKILDDAAIRIVRMSSPFAPFTEEMRNDTDILEIIRTWQFKGRRYISGS